MGPSPVSRSPLSAWAFPHVGAGEGSGFLLWTRAKHWCLSLHPVYEADNDLFPFNRSAGEALVHSKGLGAPPV